MMTVENWNAFHAVAVTIHQLEWSHSDDAADSSVHLKHRPWNACRPAAGVVPLLIFGDQHLERMVALLDQPIGLRMIGRTKHLLYAELLADLRYLALEFAAIVALQYLHAARHRKNDVQLCCYGCRLLGCDRPCPVEARAMISHVHDVAVIRASGHFRALTQIAEKARQLRV